MTHPVLAAQLYTVRDFTKTASDLAETLRKVANIGYTAVQVSAIGPIPHGEVKQMVDDLGLTICNTHIGYDALWGDLDPVTARILGHIHPGITLLVPCHSPAVRAAQIPTNALQWKPAQWAKSWLPPA